MKIDLQALRERETRGYITCRAHPTNELFIWNYTSLCQYERAWDDITLQARGLITRPDGEIVGRPFGKFFNIGENQAALPLEPFTVTTKMDGSLGILYFLDGVPYIATRGSFSSEQAHRGTQILHSRYRDIHPLLKEHSQYTYLFEIIYPDNRIVVNYGNMEDLVLLAVIDTETGKDIDIHENAWRAMWPFPIVKRYDGIKDIEQLRQLEEDNAEGFVVHFESGLRVKLKFQEYVRLHRILTKINERTIWELLINNQPFDTLLDQVPDEFYAWVSATRDEFLAQYAKIELECLKMYEQVKKISTRKEQADVIRTFKYAAIVFRMLDGKNYAEIIWKQLRPIGEQPFREDMDA